MSLVKARSLEWALIRHNWVLIKRGDGDAHIHTHTHENEGRLGPCVYKLRNTRDGQRATRISRRGLGQIPHDCPQKEPVLQRP